MEFTESVENVTNQRPALPLSAPLLRDREVKDFSLVQNLSSHHDSRNATASLANESGDSRQFHRFPQRLFRPTCGLSCFPQNFGYPPRVLRVMEGANHKLRFRRSLISHGSPGPSRNSPHPTGAHNSHPP